MTESTKEEFSVWAVGEHHFSHNHQIISLPEGWVRVPSGDAALTRRIKAAGEYWVILGRYKNKITKQGLCAPQTIVDKIQAELKNERQDPAYQKKLDAGKRYRDNQQKAYVENFEQEIINFLHFHPRWQHVAEKLAKAVTQHATPVGSGTVARTQSIPIEQRAEAAVIAWMRHQTTAYDDMYIARIKGQRRQVRQKLAENSRQLLNAYRKGHDIDLQTCPLANALNLTGALPMN